MNSNHKIWGNLLKVSLGMILVLSFLQVKMKFGWDPLDRCCLPPDSILIESISLSDSVINIKVDNTHNLLAQIKPANAANQNLKWSSSDTTVATVDSTTGRVTATGKGGECIITVAATDDSGKSANIKIKVYRDTVILVDTIISQNSNGEITLNPSSQFRIDTKTLPENAANKTLKWKSDNEGVATVNNGVVMGKDVGYCTITASSTDGGDVHWSTKVRVLEPDNPIVKVTSIVLDKSNISMNVGEQYKIRAIVSPSNASNKVVKWQSSNTTIATINNGKIVASRAGDCIITASSMDGSNVSSTTRVHVSPKSNPEPPRLQGNTIEEKIKYGLSYFSNPNNAIENKTIIANQMSKLFDDSAEVIVKRQNFDQINPNAKDYIVTISTSKLKVTYIGHEVNAKGLITELTVKQY